jgi:DNA-binding transcriptional LysR family regulator
LELRHLRYFVAVAEELSFRRAAERLFMEQPPLSRQIQQLEKEVGVALFERIKRHIELTAAGRVFLEEARRTLVSADQAIHAARQAGREAEKSLVVGFCIAKCSDAFDCAFPGVMQAFRKQRPDVAITLKEMCSPTQTQALLEREIDVGFLQIPAAHTVFAGHCLLREPMTLALPQDHPLAKLPIVPLKALASERFLLFPAHVYPSLHQEIVAACARAGFQPNIVEEVSTSQTALGLVGTGMGITFVSAAPVGVPPPGVVYRSVPDLSLSLELSVAWRRDNASTVLAEIVGLARTLF